MRFLSARSLRYRDRHDAEQWFLDRQDDGTACVTRAYGLLLRTLVANSEIFGLEGQIEGGIAIDLGYPLSERLRSEEGKVLNPCFRDYKVMTAPEMPAIDMRFIESMCPEGPLGAKGIAELLAIDPAPAVANAVYNATGIDFFAPPMVPEKVERVLHKTR